MTVHQAEANVKMRTNGKAIATLVLGMLSILLPYAGFALGILTILLAKSSLKAIGQTKEKGQALASAGLVFGMVASMVYGLLLLIALFRYLF